MVIAVFLPRVESSTFLRVQDNTLIESGDGWGFIVLAVIALAGVFRVVQRQPKDAGTTLLIQTGRPPLHAVRAEPQRERSWTSAPCGAPE
jgi:hypothetical protein